MEANWSEVRLGDVLELKRGYDLPQRLRSPGAVPVVSSSGISGAHAEKKVKGPGVVTGRYGTIGQVFYIEHDFWPLNTTLYVKDFKGSDPRFVSYFLRTIDFHAYMDKAAVPGVNRNHLHMAQVRFPPYAEQCVIASVLGALDDKIDLNRRMNETLEAMARALFKDWFVDFGPVQGKAEGKPPPGLSPDIAALFPDAFDDDDKPVGWGFGCLGDVAESPRRGIRPGDVSPETPYIGLEHMPRRSIALTEWEGAGKVTSGKSVFKQGELLFGKLRPYFHKVGVAPLGGICSTDIVVLRPISLKWSSYVLACISSDEFVAYTNQTSTGTKMPRTSWKEMARYQICLPSIKVTQAFQSMTQSMIDRVIANIHENRTLAQLRDLLLPKLLSGEIRLREAEKAVEAVA